jgi:hypothetical protein
MGSYSLIEDVGELERMAAGLGRECGKCSLCCKVFDVPEISKPAGPWCPHCDPGKRRCTIYGARPPTCVDFFCQWLVDRTLGPEWFPARCKMVLKVSPNERAPPALRLDVNVDPSFPNAWRQPPYYGRLRAMSGEVAVHVYVGRRRFAVLPGGEVEGQHQ